MGMAPQDEESKEAVQLYGSLTGSGGNNIGKPPRQENYFDMWKSAFCPQFTCFSFTFIIFAINTVMYLLTLFATWFGSGELNRFVFLGPDLKTLHAWGALDAYEIRYNWQVWRLFTSLLLSTGFTTWGISSVALLVIGFMAESPKMSAVKMGIFYMLVGTLANLFSVSVDFDCSVGNLPAIMGIVAGMLGSVAINWNALAGAGMLRICLIFMMAFLIVILLLLTANSQLAGLQWESVSIAGMGGGCMVGIGLGMMLFPYALQRPSPYVKMIRKIGFGLTFLYSVILIPVFWLSVEPSPTKWSVPFF